MAHASNIQSHPLRTLSSLAGVITLATLLGACRVDGFHQGPGQTVVFVNEIEPNNLAAQANYFGFLEPSETVVIQGSVAGLDGSGPDGVDGFEFSSPGGVHVTFFLDSVDSNSDVDVCLFDPVSGLYLACWESPFADESGEFWVDNLGADYQLVVIAADAASAYTLEVSADFFFSSYSAKAADDEAAGPALITESGGGIQKEVTRRLAEAYSGPARSVSAELEAGGGGGGAVLELDSAGNATLSRQ